MDNGEAVVSDIGYARIFGNRADMNFLRSQEHHPRDFEFRPAVGQARMRNERHFACLSTWAPAEKTAVAARFCPGC